MDVVLSPNPTTQEVYEFQRAYFSRPDAVLAKKIQRYSDEGHPITSCLYRDPEGNKCAVGCLISDSLYESSIETWGDEEEEEEEATHETLGEEIEGNPVEEIVRWPQLQELLNGKTKEGQRKLFFLEEAQKLHDETATDAADLVRLLDLLAQDFDLELVTS